MTMPFAAAAPASSRPQSSFPRSSWLSWTTAFALCLSAALIGIESWQMWHVRQESLRSAKIVTASLAESLAQQIDNTLKTADTVVATLAQRVEVEGMNPDTRQRLYGLMTSLAAALPAIHEMGVTDKNGNALVKSLVPNPTGMNYSERDYFRYLKSHETHDVFIGQPVKSKVDGSLNLTVSRRINAKDGSFAGVVVSSVSMEFFRKLFNLVEDKSGVSITLVAANGTPLASSPKNFGEDELAALDASPAGALEYFSTKDRVYRVGSHNHLQRYPMTVVVAQNSSVILSAWNDQLRVHGTIVLAILAVIGVLGYRVNQANRAMQRQALRDGLTGLANRRYFDDKLAREIRRATRNWQSLSLIMVDIDHFKNFNDHYGHPAGDACLRTVSDAVKSVLRRPGDVAARYGGEEIAIVLPATDVAGAVQVVADLQRTISELAIRHEASSHGIVTLSAGVACWSPGRGAETCTWLVEAADAALYVAKSRGRNTFTVHPNAEIETAAAPSAHEIAA